MANSWVEVCNQALVYLGSDRIQALTEANDRARICNERYQSVADAVMGEHLWSAAEKQTSLASDSTAPLYGYDYKYQLPVDCLYIREVTDTDGGLITNWKRIGQFIHCDENALLLGYTKQITDPTELDPLLAESIAARLAMEIAYRITKSNPIADRCAVIYAAKITAAKFNDAEENPDRDLAGLVPDSTGTKWLKVRK